MNLSISKKILSVWFSILWRGLLIGFVIGFSIALINGLLGSPLATLEVRGVIYLVAVTYGNMLAMKLGLAANNILVDK